MRAIWWLTSSGSPLRQLRHQSVASPSYYSAASLAVLQLLHCRLGVRGGDLGYRRSVGCDLRTFDREISVGVTPMPSEVRGACAAYKPFLTSAFNRADIYRPLCSDRRRELVWSLRSRRSSMVAGRAWTNHRNDMTDPAEIPWNETATAVRISLAGGSGPIEPSILFEGPLHIVIQKLADWPQRDLDAVRVMLGDRSARPNSFEGQLLSDLFGLTPPR